MDADQFRNDFPEFADTTKYPDAVVSLWLSVGVLSLPVDRWDTLYNIGLELFTAHHLVIASKNTGAAGAGGALGSVQGPVASKSVDKVSVSYDAGAVSLTDGGFWNMTAYGIQFLQMARMIGAGGIQL